MAFTQKILVPTDLSLASALAFEAAAILATQFGAELVVLYVYDPTLLMPLYALPGAASLIRDPARAPAFEESARKELKELTASHFEGMSRVSIAFEQHANAAEGICQYAKREGIDLIVLSTHGRTGLSHMLIGSVAERVVRHADCPVLTLRSKAK